MSDERAALELILRKHLPVPVGDVVLCICDVRLTYDGPVAHRLHVADALLDGPASRNETFLEWGIQWPDGRILPPSMNETPVGYPTRPPLHAHRGARWVCRSVSRTSWQPWTGKVTP